MGEEQKYRFPRPDWDQLWSELETGLPQEERRQAWLEQAHLWLTDTAAALGSDFQVHEAGKFWIVSNRNDTELKRMSVWLRRARAEILTQLDGVAADPYSRLAVLWLEDDEQYYEYVSWFYPDSGEFAFSGGMFLSGGYPHFVFPHYDEVWQLEHVIAHELTHALVSHLPLPLWTNEGMAVTLEEMIAGGNNFRMDPQLVEEHRAFWNEENIQEFWSGASFSRSDDGNRLSYSLAQLTTLNFSRDYPKYREFALSVNWADGGETATRAVFDISLEDLLAELLGEGHWKPQPELWVRLQHRPDSG